MSFQWIDILWLLLVAPPPLVAGYIWVLRRRRKEALVFSHLPFLKHSQRRVWRRHVPPALLLASLCLLIIAAARPQAVITLASRGGTIVMAMDVSGSMRAADVAPNRITAAQAAAKDFVDHRDKAIKIAIVGFSGAAFLVQAPTIDTTALDAAIASLQPQFTTAIGSAVITSLKTIFPDAPVSLMVPGSLEFVSGAELNDPSKRAAPPKPPDPVPPGSYKSAAIVLMTDGRNTVGPDPVDAARAAANMGVRIFTIGYGSTSASGGSQTVNIYGRSVRAMIDEPQLKRMATMTGGQYFHAQTAMELTKIYALITTKLQKETQEIEISAFFVAAALAFAIASALVSLLWFGRVF